MAQHGQVLRLKARRPDGKVLWAYRYRVNGRCSRRLQVGGFATRAEAERALRKTLAHLRPGGGMTLAELVDEYLRVHQAAPATIEKLRWLLGKSIGEFGDVRLVDLRAEEICAWRGTVPEGHRFEATQALRQVLNAAVAWQLIDANPARRGVPNPLRRFPEKRPFESWAQLRAVAQHLGPVTGPMVMFGAATGLRPAELAALEQRDIDRIGGVVYVRRQLVRGRLKQTKTGRSVRAVPLQSVALESLDRLPASESLILFPASQGGYIDLHNFRAREWRPAQVAAGIDLIRRPYDLRHTYATFALRAGISIFDLSRFMGASLAMIDKHYGHLARDRRRGAPRACVEVGSAIRRFPDAGQRPDGERLAYLWQKGICRRVRVRRAAGRFPRLSVGSRGELAGRRRLVEHRTAGAA